MNMLNEKHLTNVQWEPKEKTGYKFFLQSRGTT